MKQTGRINQEHEVNTLESVRRTRFTVSVDNSPRVYTSVTGSLSWLYKVAVYHREHSLAAGNIQCCRGWREHGCWLAASVPNTSSVIGRAADRTCVLHGQLRHCTESRYSLLKSRWTSIIRICTVVHAYLFHFLLLSMVVDAIPNHNQFPSIYGITASRGKLFVCCIREVIIIILLI